jgi:hypothetical protein
MGAVIKERAMERDGRNVNEKKETPFMQMLSPV